MTIFEEILSLLSGSPELHAYLLARPEQLQTTDYADIIAGAPVALMKKKRLLDRLSGYEAHSEDTGLIRDYSACLNTALQALESKEAVFSAELWKDAEQLDGPYIALSVEEVQRAIPRYWENGDTAIAYWRIEQYCQGAHRILMGSHAPNTPLPPIRMEKYSILCTIPKKAGACGRTALSGEMRPI